MFVAITYHPLTSVESTFILYTIQWKTSVNTHLYLSMYCDNWECDLETWMQRRFKSIL